MKSVVLLLILGAVFSNASAGLELLRTSWESYDDYYVDHYDPVEGEGYIWAYVRPAVVLELSNGDEFGKSLPALNILEAKTKKRWTVYSEEWLQDAEFSEVRQHRIRVIEFVLGNGKGELDACSLDLSSSEVLATKMPLVDIREEHSDK